MSERKGRRCTWTFKAICMEGLSFVTISSSKCEQGGALEHQQLRQGTEEVGTVKCQEVGAEGNVNTVKGM